MISLNRVLLIEAGLEVLTSVVCVIANVYFSCRFGRLNQFSQNLRVLLVFSHVVTAIATLVHPFTQFIPEHMHSLTLGNYFGAFVVYGMYFVVHLTILLMDCKYLLIAVERRVAFEQKENYEDRGAKLAYSMITAISLFFSLFLIMKVVIYFFIYPNETADWKLINALNLDRTSLSLLYANVVAEICWLYGLLEFMRLQQNVKANRYRAKSLSESYLIKEVEVITRSLRPIMFAFTLLMCSAGTLMMFMQYLHLIRGYQLATGITQAIASAIYVLIGCYNVFSTAYLVHSLPPMKTILRDDFRRLFCRSQTQVQPTPRGINWIAEREDHFDYLKDAWN